MDINVIDKLVKQEANRLVKENQELILDYLNDRGYLFYNDISDYIPNSVGRQFVFSISEILEIETHSLEFSVDGNFEGIIFLYATDFTIDQLDALTKKHYRTQM